MNIYSSLLSLFVNSFICRLNDFELTPPARFFFPELDFMSEHFDISTANTIICFNFLPPFHFAPYNKNRSILHCVHDDNDKLNETQLVLPDIQH